LIFIEILVGTFREEALGLLRIVKCPWRGGQSPLLDRVGGWPRRMEWRWLSTQGKKKARQGGLVGPVLPPLQYSQRGEGRRNTAATNEYYRYPCPESVCSLSRYVTACKKSLQNFK